MVNIMLWLDYLVLAVVQTAAAFYVDDFKVAKELAMQVAAYAHTAYTAGKVPVDGLAMAQISIAAAELPMGHVCIDFQSTHMRGRSGAQAEFDRNPEFRRRPPDVGTSRKGACRGRAKAPDATRPPEIPVSLQFAFVCELPLQGFFLVSLSLHRTCEYGRFYFRPGN